jgi:hypothetical protein
MSGIDALRGMSKRHVPTPRHPREDSAPVTMPTTADTEVLTDDDTLPEFDISTPVAATRQQAARAGAGAPSKPQRGTAPPAAAAATTRGYQRREEGQVNLGVRVPRELDNKLMGLVYHLRLQGVRTSKAELVALALENLPQEPTPALTRALHKQRP